MPECMKKNQKVESDLGEVTEKTQSIYGGN